MVNDKQAKKDQAKERFVATAEGLTVEFPEPSGGEPEKKETQD